MITFNVEDIQHRNLQSDVAKYHLNFLHNSAHCVNSIISPIISVDIL